MDVNNQYFIIVPDFLILVKIINFVVFRKKVKIITVLLNLLARESNVQLQEKRERE